MLYRLLYKRVLAKTDPEQAHKAAMRLIGAFGRSPLAGLSSATVGRLGGDRLRGLLARPVPGRLGLAAGQDKNATAVLGTIAMGFAFTEVGTVTPLPQPGNDRPRLWRLPEERAFRNRMGFNNDGADAAAVRLRALRSTKAGRSAVVGANIGKNKTTPEEDAPRDYAYCARVLAPWVDFIVINVSSPNTPGLRDLQSVDRLRPIVEAARDGSRQACPDRDIPLFVKIAPDLSDEEIVGVCGLSRSMGLAGVVATNTTVNHDLGQGGVSGAPLRERALDVIRLVAANLDDSQLLIGTGGVSSPADARRMLGAGADLVEAFTAFIYEGPTWPGALARALQRP